MSERRNKLTEVILLCVRSVDNCSSPMKTTKNLIRNRKDQLSSFSKTYQQKNKIFLKMMIERFSKKR